MILENTIQSFIDSLPAHASLLVAYSGGMDSHVLLHALKHCTQHHKIRAIYLNHGLNPKALQWQQHAQQVCQDLHILFMAHTLNLTIKKGESIEAIARNARYDYFATVLQPGEILCTAHHQDDQLETVLLQLMRGAGPKGLSAMALMESFAQGAHARPLLSVDRALLQDYAKAHQLHWVHDDSNDNIQFDRNFFRHEIIPLLKERFPQIAATVARSAQHCASTQLVLSDYLSQELMALQGDFPDTLSREKLAQFNDEKQSFLLREFISQKNIPLPSTEQLAQIKKMLTARTDAESEVNWQFYSARFYRDDLFIAHQGFFKPVDLPEIPWDGITPLQLLHGTLTLTPSQIGKISPRILENPITIRFRGQDISLKKIFQEANIPSWQRWQLPLLYVDNECVAIAGTHYVAPAYRSGKDEAGLALSFMKG